jgi:HEAT repeat protein
MKQDTTEKVRHLLRPADDDESWYQEIMALDRDEAIPLLIGYLENEQESLYTRRLCIQILSLLRDDRAISAIARALSANDRILRGRAAEALGQFEGLEQSVIEQLTQGLQDEDYFMRECCAKALGQLKRPEALLALEQMSISDSVPTNREVARKAIDLIQEEA